MFWNHFFGAKKMFGPKTNFELENYIVTKIFMDLIISLDQTFCLELSFLTDHFFRTKPFLGQPQHFQVVVRPSYMPLWRCLCVFALDKIQFMKWPLRNCGATYLRDVTDTVQTVQYSDSQCTQQQYWHEPRRCSWLHAGLY